MLGNSPVRFATSSLQAGRARWRELLAKGTETARTKALSILYHGPVVDERFATLVPAARADVVFPWILAELRRRGAPDLCYVISNDDELDGRSMPLEAALAGVYCGDMGAIISCIPGKLAYYEGEDPGERYILELLAVLAASPGRAPIRRRPQEDRGTRPPQC